MKKTPKSNNSRAIALQVLLKVWRDQRSLSEVFPELAAPLDSRDRALAQELSYGVCRWFGVLQQHLRPMLKKPLKAKDLDVELALMLGLYQLSALRIEAHAAVNESVNLVAKSGKSWAKGMTNAILRRCQREPLNLDGVTAEDLHSCWPQWLWAQLQSDWPEHWPEIAEASQHSADLCLRVNQRQISTDTYLKALQAAGLDALPRPGLPAALSLNQGRAVELLPGYEAGWFSVQDAAAQYAAELLQLQDGQTVLDACAAPGGKSAHILERAAVDLVCLEVSEKRLPRLQQNLDRLQLNAHIVCADAAADLPELPSFDRILLDAPCSATGIIRRHPDIRWLRQASDLPGLLQTQQRLLQKCWQRLKPGGLLLYATCSLLKQENEEQIAAFLAQQDDAEELPFDAAGWGQAARYGRQILPGQQGMDGFYYARLLKHRNA